MPPSSPLSPLIGRDKRVYSETHVWHALHAGKDEGQEKTWSAEKISLKSPDYESIRADKCLFKKKKRLFTIKTFTLDINYSETDTVKDGTQYTTLSDPEFTTYFYSK